MKLSQHKYFLFSFLLSFCLFVFSSYMMTMGLDKAVLVSAIAFESFTIILVEKWKDKYNPFLVFLGILLPVLSIEIPLRVIYFEATLCSLMSAIAMVVGIIAGFVLWKLVFDSNKKNVESSE